MRLCYEICEEDAIHKAYLSSPCHQFIPSIYMIRRSRVEGVKMIMSSIPPSTLPTLESHLVCFTTIDICHHLKRNYKLQNNMALSPNHFMTCLSCELLPRPPPPPQNELFLTSRSLSLLDKCAIKVRILIALHPYEMKTLYRNFWLCFL